MNKTDYELLVNNKVLTDVGMVSTHLAKPELIEELNIDDLISKGFLPQPALNSIIKEQGVFAIDGMSKEEFYALLEKGGEIKLMNDIVLDTEYASIKKNTTLDLNGHTITALTRTTTSGEVSYGLVVFEGAELTINGTGKIETNRGTYSTPIWAYGGKVTINGGEYVNAGSGCDLIYASKTGHIVINDGIFKACFNDHSEPSANNDYNAINVLDADVENCEIHVRGGKFYGFDPANNLSEGPDTNFMDSGFKTVKNGEWYEVVKA